MSLTRSQIIWGSGQTPGIRTGFVCGRGVGVAGSVCGCEERAPQENPAHSPGREPWMREPWMREPRMGSDGRTRGEAAC